MPFTQRHKLNIGDGTACDTNPTLSQVNLCRTVKCDGCDERCELGYKNCLFKDVIYPTIGTNMKRVYELQNHVVLKLNDINSGTKEMSTWIKASELQNRVIIDRLENAK